MATKEELQAHIDALKLDLSECRDKLKAEREQTSSLKADRDDLKDKLGKLRTKLAQEAKEMRLKRANVGRQAHHGKGSV